jgi:hypothetical protein
VLPQVNALRGIVVVGSQSFTTGKEKLPNLPNLPKYDNGIFGIVRELGCEHGS